MAVGLDVGGVDFLIDDITKSYKDIGGAIVEVNAAPGFRMHVAPSEGQPRDVAGKVIDMLFPTTEETPHPDCGDHGYQRQDNDVTDAGAYHENQRQHGWHDLDRRRLCRR